MKSKPTAITFNREWANPKGGTVYYFEIKFDNGDEGQFSSSKKDQTKFKVGTEIEYEQTGTSKTGTRMFNIIKTFGTQSNRDNPDILSQTAMSVCIGAMVKIYKAFNLQLVRNNIIADAHVAHRWIAPFEKRDICSIKWNSLLNAAEFLMYLPEDKIKAIKTTPLEALMETARIFYDSLKVNNTETSNTTNL